MPNFSITNLSFSAFKLTSSSLEKLVIFVMSITILVKAAQNLPSVDSLNQYQPPASTTIYAADGTTLGQLFKENRTWVSIKEVPKDLKNAIIAVEDARFYKHHGVDIIGVTRAARAMLRKEAGIPVRAVGMIADPRQAEDIVGSGKADMVALARGLLDDPRWVWHAAERFGVELDYPPQYARSRHDLWPGSKLARRGS